MSKHIFTLPDGTYTYDDPVAPNPLTAGELRRYAWRSSSGHGPPDINDPHLRAYLANYLRICVLRDTPVHAFDPAAVVYSVQSQGEPPRYSLQGEYSIRAPWPD